MVNRLVIEIHADTSRFEYALKALADEVAAADCWEMVGDVEAALAEYCGDHRWAEHLYGSLAMATQSMKADAVAEALDNIYQELATDAPALAQKARNAFEAVRSQELNLSISLGNR
jgi:hypothetical protein